MAKYYLFFNIISLEFDIFGPTRSNTFHFVTTIFLRKISFQLAISLDYEASSKFGACPINWNRNSYNFCTAIPDLCTAALFWCDVQYWPVIVVNITWEYQKIEAITFSANRIVFVFFRAGSPRTVHSFDWSLVSEVVTWVRLNMSKIAEQCLLDLAFVYLN